MLAFYTESYKSQLLLASKRRSPQRIASDDAEECSMWALSMYESEAQGYKSLYHVSEEDEKYQKSYW